MQQDFFVAITFFAHDGSTYLAKAYSMAPTGTGKDKLTRNTFWRNIFLIYDECRTIQVRSRERTTNFQFLTNGECVLGTYDFQLPKTTTGATCHWNKINNLTIVNT